MHDDKWQTCIKIDTYDRQQKCKNGKLCVQLTHTKKDAKMHCFIHV